MPNAPLSIKNGTYLDLRLSCLRHRMARRTRTNPGMRPQKKTCTAPGFSRETLLNVTAGYKRARVSHRKPSCSAISFATGGLYA